MNTGLNNLLELHGQEVHREDGYWWKIEVWQVAPSKHRPHGIRYNLTLHNKYNKRVFGMDNAHAVKEPKKKKYAGKRHDYDHVHKSASDKGTPYEFTDCSTLLNDFFGGVDKTIEAIEGK
ncbi:hypothetical protein K0I73_13655 [Shewanella mesophila]|uniref:DUF6516 family protein n=1 Tax=Shewanella mesophila TaxID=2864208 RepID=UPI001C657EB2|nr:DUF6516 family protein [Shewanella mesophila]QYJ85243.1 hypothetical protein K0I73_13655 [Shewanella mesophila]